MGLLGDLECSEFLFHLDEAGYPPPQNVLLVVVGLFGFVELLKFGHIGDIAVLLIGLT